VTVSIHQTIRRCSTNPATAETNREAGQRRFLGRVRVRAGERIADFIATNRITGSAFSMADAHMLAADDGRTRLFDGRRRAFSVMAAAR